MIDTTLIAKANEVSENIVSDFIDYCRGNLEEGSFCFSSSTYEDIKKTKLIFSDKGKWGACGFLEDYLCEVYEDEDYDLEGFELYLVSDDGEWPCAIAIKCEGAGDCYAWPVITFDAVEDEGLGVTVITFQE